MSGFSIDWLNLRETADLRARDHDMLRMAWQWLRSSDAGGPDIVVDLGAGTGSTLRAFAFVAAERLQQPEKTVLKAAQHDTVWRLVDHDTALLAEAKRRHGTDHQITTHHADLLHPAALPLQDARIITASALFDLVSTQVINELVTAIAAQDNSTGFYAALNYDGITRWTPEHPLDAEVLRAFNEDQRRDKGMGPALGPDSSGYLSDVFQQAGFQVSMAESPWLLDDDDELLVTELIKGIYDAVRNDPALDSSSLLDWREFRLSKVATGTCKVGHKDFMALPRD